MKRILVAKQTLVGGIKLGPMCYNHTNLLKDLRNKIENQNPEDVLNGNIDQFIEGGVINS